MSMSLRKLVLEAGVQPNPNGGTRCKTPVFRSTYAFVFEPKETPNGEMKYQICMIYNKKDSADWKAVIQAIANAAAKKFGIEVNKWPKNLKSPIRDGDEERDNKEYNNSMFMNAGNKSQPGIVDRQLNPIMSSEEFYSGCYARASLNFYSYDVNGNKGVGTGLNNLIKWSDGDRLDGSVKAEDDFAEYKEDASEEDNLDNDVCPSK